MKILNEQEGLAIVSSPDNLTAYLKEYKRLEKTAIAKSEGEGSSVKKIVNIILGENNRKEK